MTTAPLAWDTVDIASDPPVKASIGHGDRWKWIVYHGLPPARILGGMPESLRDREDMHHIFAYVYVNPDEETLFVGAGARYVHVTSAHTRNYALALCDDLERSQPSVTWDGVTRYVLGR